MLVGTDLRRPGDAGTLKSRQAGRQAVCDYHKRPKFKSVSKLHFRECINSNFRFC